MVKKSQKTPGTTPILGTEVRNGGGTPSPEKRPPSSEDEGLMGHSEGGRVQLKRKITLLQAVSLIVGSIIGSGIFVSPGGVLQYVGSGGMALIVWAVCGILCTVGALCFCELGTMLPASGGEYTYILHAFGNLPAFLTLWANILVIRPGAQAVVALAFAEYSMALWFKGRDTPQTSVILLAALALSLLTFVNCVSVRVAMRIQTLFTSAKIVALVAIILAGLLQLVNGNANVSGALTSSLSQELDAGRLSMALYSGLFAYGGWNYVNFATEELKNPQRNLPLSIWISLPLVTGIYVLANLAYLLVLTPQEIVASQAVAVLFGERVLGVLKYSVPVFVALSTFGSLNGILFTSGRLFLTGARNGHLPPALSYINLHTRTPIPALILTCSLSFLMIGFGILFLINCLSFVLWLSIGLAVAALLKLRRSDADRHRPIKVPLVLPVLFLVCCIFLVVFPMLTEPRSTGLGVVLLIAGLPVYMFVRMRRKPEIVLRCYYCFEKWVQKLFLVVPPE